MKSQWGHGESHACDCQGRYVGGLWILDTCGWLQKRAVLWKALNLWALWEHSGLAGHLVGATTQFQGGGTHGLPGPVWEMISSSIKLRVLMAAITTPWGYLGDSSSNSGWSSANSYNMWIHSCIYSLSFLTVISKIQLETGSHRTAAACSWSVSP